VAIVSIKNARKDHVLDPEEVKMTLNKYPTKGGSSEDSTRTFTGQKATYKGYFLWSIED
jgi:hypothetical protein